MSNYKEIDGKKYKIANPTIKNDSDSVCFLVEGKYYRLAKGSITYDYTKKRYVLRSSINVENGFIGIDDTDNPILGDWSWPSNHLLEDNITAYYKGENFYCISEDIFKDSAWEERLSDGIFYRKSDLPVKEFSKIKAVSKNVKHTFPYNAGGDVLKKAIKIYKEKYSTKEFNKGVSNYPQVLGKYSYGFEFETVKGIIPQRICNKLGLIPLRDGSIDGIEYATVPLEGKNGIQTIIDSCVELEKRTSYNHDCSLHIHIGGMPRTETYFTSLAKVLCHVQEEIYELFPFYTRGGFGLKKKDYTAPLPATHLLSKINDKIDLKNKDEINANFQHIFEFLSMGHNYKDYDYNLKKVVSHPSDPHGTSKWYVKSRYRWVNMIPLLFGNKKTIEFRIHTPTYDYNKILYFTILCAAIIDFADKSKKSILGGKFNQGDYRLSEIIYKYLAQFGDKYSQLQEYIHRYIEDRKVYISKSTRKGDFYGDENEFKNRFNIYNSVTNNYDVITKSKLNALFKELERNTTYTRGYHTTYQHRPRPVTFATTTDGRVGRIEPNAAAFRDLERAIRDGRG